MITPYQTEESKKRQVSNMFDNISGYYDFLNHFLSLGIDKSWRRKAVALLKSDKPTHILDMATGTADLAIEAKKQLGQVKVTGIDISPKMLEIGRKKIQKLQLSDAIELEVGDSEQIRFETGTFDSAMVAFGVRNFENLDKGILELNRVLKTGGRIVVLEFSKPRGFIFKGMFNFYFKYILPVIGRLTSKDRRAYAYLYESVQAFPDGADFGAVMERNGFTAIDMKPLTFGICTLYTGVKK